MPVNNTYPKKLEIQYLRTESKKEDWNYTREIPPAGQILCQSDICNDFIEV